MREHGVIVKKCRGCLRVALLYPSLYEAAVASLAYQLLYYMLNSLDWVAAERFILPSLGDLSEPLRSLETGSRLDSFDAIIAPVSYELDLVYLIHALAASGIEPRAPRRSKPWVIVGGPVPSMNPAPSLRVADVVVVGEAEPTIPRLLEALVEESLDSLSGGNGFLTHPVVEGGERARRVYVSSLDEAPHPVLEFRVPGSGEPWGEAYMVEVSRGCRWMCRFCMEAFFTLPWRVRSYARVRSLIEEGVAANRVRRVAFYSLSFFDHPAADRLLEYVAGEGLEASIGSLRADTLNEDRLALLKMVGQRTLTIAPETFSERLSCLLGKRIGYSLVEGLVEEAVRLGLKPKLYLMTGVPGESLEDTRRDAELAARLVRVSRGVLRVTLNPLVPKPWTPLQYARFIGEEEYEARVRLYKRLLGGRVEALSYRWAYAQAVIARGGFDTGDALVKVASETTRLGRVLRSLRGTSGDKAAREGLEPGETLPWVELVDPGYPVAALVKSLESGLACLGRR